MSDNVPTPPYTALPIGLNISEKDEKVPAENDQLVGTSTNNGTFVKAYDMRPIPEPPMASYQFETQPLPGPQQVRYVYQPDQPKKRRCCSCCVPMSRRGKICCMTFWSILLVIAGIYTALRLTIGSPSAWINSLSTIQTTSASYTASPANALQISVVNGADAQIRLLSGLTASVNVSLQHSSFALGGWGQVSTDTLSPGVLRINTPGGRVWWSGYPSYRVQVDVTLPSSLNGTDVTLINDIVCGGTTVSDIKNPSLGKILIDFADNNFIFGLSACADGGFSVGALNAKSLDIRSIDQSIVVSGPVTLASDLLLRSVSGYIQATGVTTTGGTTDLNTVSGNIYVNMTGPATASFSTTSGNIDGSAKGYNGLKVKSVSGHANLQLAPTSGSMTDVYSTSGWVGLTLAGYAGGFSASSTSGRIDTGGRGQSGTVGSGTAQLTAGTPLPPILLKEKSLTILRIIK
ncbi:hypothetical protein BC830DRAFT_1221662 [Chytriomyces sp. MP71]|nr:hypothetical protein BC830DRAFT_1221662 [Chytriomyces sp. MP71]